MRNVCVRASTPFVLPHFCQPIEDCLLHSDQPIDLLLPLAGLLKGAAGFVGR